MNDNQIAQMIEMMQKLGPAKVRVIQYEMNGGHRCDASSNLMTCCGEKRCQSCHIPHLKQVHGEAALHAYAKFASTQTLTWKGKAYKQPLPVDKPKVNKVNKKPSPAPKQLMNTRDFANSIPADQLAEVMAILKAMENK